MELSVMHPSTDDKHHVAGAQTTYIGDTTNLTAQVSSSASMEPSGESAPLDGREQRYQVYKIRWFGLVQLVLLNIIVSWDWLSFSPVANTAASFFSTTPSVINWLSTAFLFAFVAASPWTIYTLNRGGPRLAMIFASLLILLGNWVRYGATRASPPSFAITMFGQMLIGLAQPFVLSAPTYYSDLWFSPRGRISATAIMSLANPFGGALGQLINPFIATNPADIPRMTLYVAIISTVATLPSFFVPAKPPMPVSRSSTHLAPSLRDSWRLLRGNATFWVITVPFWIYVGFFNSISSLLTQIMTPYGFSEDESGIAGAVLILAGLVFAAVISPIVDRSKAYILMIRTLVPVIAVSYLAFIWCPGTRNIAAPYAILAILGAVSFSLVPIALEFLVEVTFPVGPEASSVICWTGGQLFGGIFIIISDALKASKDADPPFTMKKALVFQAVVASAFMPCVFLLGRIGSVKSKRLLLDKQTSAPER